MTDQQPDHIIASANLSFPVRSPEAATQVMDAVEEEAPAQPSKDFTTPWAATTTPPAFETNPHFYSVELPSKGAFYKNEGVVAVQHVRGKQQVKFTRAAKEKSFRYTMEAVASCVAGASVMQMTLMDAYYLMYWLRINSYVKNKFSAISICTNPQHRLEVAMKKKEPATLRTVEIITGTNLDVRTLDPKVLEEFLANPDYVEAQDEIFAAGLRLGPCLVKDAIETTEQESVDEGALDSDDEALFDMACFLHSVDPSKPMSLAERKVIVEGFTADTIHYLEAWQVLCSDYGVKETRKAVCKECGHEQQVEILLSAHDFF